MGVVEGLPGGGKVLGREAGRGAGTGSKGGWREGDRPQGKQGPQPFGDENSSMGFN